jgi:hypothetical protein
MHHVALIPLFLIRFQVLSPDVGRNLANYHHLPQFVLRSLYLDTMQLINLSTSYKDEEPEFGHGMLKHFALDPSYINMNNGAKGF